MGSEILLYVLLAMIFYDFSLHLIELLFGRERGRKLRYYWPRYRVKGEFSRRYYTAFWTLYWGVALSLLVAYLVA
jgi:hypothetical protein